MKRVGFKAFLLNPHINLILKLADQSTVIHNQLSGKTGRIKSDKHFEYLPDL